MPVELPHWAQIQGNAMIEMEEVVENAGLEGYVLDRDCILFHPVEGHRDNRGWLVACVLQKVSDLYFRNSPRDKIAISYIQMKDATGTVVFSYPNHQTKDDYAVGREVVIKESNDLFKVFRLPTIEVPPRVE